MNKENKDIFNNLLLKKILVRILLAIFIFVLSALILANKVPEMQWVESAIERLDESKNKIMELSGSTIAMSLAISALPDDFATPLADTLMDMNRYFILIFAVIFIEKLIVVEGIRISFLYIIPTSCISYILSVISKKDVFLKFAAKMLILGISVIVVIPFSTYVAEDVGASYLTYVDETIVEAEAGADKITEIMDTDNGETTIFEKLSDAFKIAAKGMSDLLKYFENIVKKCANSIAIMLVTTCIIPIMVLVFFRWLLKELFSFHLALPNVKIRVPQRKAEKNSDSE
ncbi:MAG: hypothetical protein E7292_02985 [Lachnospiraceae bacterium]|nr:hypothetical protein [Lachnospiraceae bacterium]